MDKLSRNGVQRILAALVVGLLSLGSVLVGIAVVNNSWRIWDTPDFCGSYADFQPPPVPDVCLSFPAYIGQSLTHLPHIGPAVLAGLLTAGGVYGWLQVSGQQT